jgi:hypothetical protein
LSIFTLNVVSSNPGYLAAKSTTTFVHAGNTILESPTFHFDQSHVTLNSAQSVIFTSHARIATHTQFVTLNIHSFTVTVSSFATYIQHATYHADIIFPLNVHPFTVIVFHHLHAVQFVHITKLSTVVNVPVSILTLAPSNAIIADSFQ